MKDLNRQNKDRIYVSSPSITSEADVQREFQLIELAFEKVARHVATEVSYEAPYKNKDLMVRYADGINWNPGKGKGLYINIPGIGWKQIQLAP